MNLHKLSSSQTAKITAVVDVTENTRQQMECFGIVSGASIKILHDCRATLPLVLQVEDCAIAIDYDLGKSIIVADN